MTAPRLILLLMYAASIAACSDNGPPPYDDVKNIVIDSKPMTAEAYVKQYCTTAGGETLRHDRCVAARGEATRTKTLKSLRIDEKEAELKRLNEGMGIKP